MFRIDIETSKAHVLVHEGDNTILSKTELNLVVFAVMSVDVLDGNKIIVYNA